VELLTADASLLEMQLREMSQAASGVQEELDRQQQLNVELQVGRRRQGRHAAGAASCSPASGQAVAEQLASSAAAWLHRQGPKAGRC
jgi:hypothetical protein